MSVQKSFSLRPSSIFADITILFIFIVIIFGITSFGQEWNAGYNPTYNIQLDLSALPLYSLFSALRGFIAYLISLLFTLVVGFWAAKSARAEKIILPFLDIMQSIPVLGFLPGLVLGLVALFPQTNVGLELAAILMIFTGQVWNMTFAFYSSLKAIPTDLKEAANVMNLDPLERMRYLELPYSAMNLTWNSLMSMAGGWFFLTVCEAFTLGDKPYRLPGLGAYMAEAIEKSDSKAIIAGILAMALVIICFDVLLWQPALAWAHRYRIEDIQDQKSEEPLIRLLIKDSIVVRWFRYLTRQNLVFRRRKTAFTKLLDRVEIPTLRVAKRERKVLAWLGLALAIGITFFATMRVGGLLLKVGLTEWGEIWRDTGFTMLRVAGAVVIGTLWATPVGIWLAQSPRRLKIAQPIIQLMASFPAPMLYPLAMAIFLFLNINFEISAMLLMLLGVQWYILFNVLAGALRIPVELRLAMRLMNSPKIDQWRYLFLPSVFPALVTGWVTAAGGAWNASIVSEIVTYHSHTLVAHGLGAQISQAAEHADFPKLTACLCVMVITVVALNRTLWARIYRVSQIRFRMDL